MVSTDRLGARFLVTRVYWGVRGGGGCAVVVLAVVIACFLEPKDPMAALPSLLTQNGMPSLQPITTTNTATAQQE